MSTTDIPDHWARRLKQHGFVRSRGGGPNLTAFAQQIGVHTSTVSNALRGGPRKPDADTIARIVAELGEDTAAWFGVKVVRAWEPPPAAALLTERQRKALDELIVSMTEGGDGHGHQPAPIVPIRTMPPTQEELDRGQAAAADDEEGPVGGDI